jgi:ubiquinone/menaquinone biosynthesis C-methylase UbiE
MKTVSQFDNAAPEWDKNLERRQFLEGLVNKLLEHLELTADMSLIDYGCGTGNASLPLAEKVAHVYAVDASQGMLEELSNKISQQSIKNITPLLLDLSVKPFPHSDIDAAFTIMAMHHVPDTDALLDNLTTAIKSGGSIHLIDLYTEDGNFHKNMEPVPHHGFNPEELADKLKQRGFTNCRHELAGTKQREHGNYPVFILSAFKV